MFSSYVKCYVIDHLHIHLMYKSGGGGLYIMPIINLIFKTKIGKESPRSVSHPLF